MFGEEADALLERIKNAGLFDGQVAVVEGAWKDTVSQVPYAFRTILTSVRDDFGGWHVVANLEPIDVAECERQCESGTGFRVLAA